MKRCVELIFLKTLTLAEALRLGKLEKLPKNEKLRKFKIVQLAKKNKATSASDRVSRELLKAQQYQARCAKRSKKQQRMRAFDNEVATTCKCCLAGLQPTVLFLSFSYETQEQKGYGAIVDEGEQERGEVPPTGTDFERRVQKGEVAESQEAKKVILTVLLLLRCLKMNKAFYRAIFMPLLGIYGPILIGKNSWRSNSIVQRFQLGIYSFLVNIP